jgi:hypothetical protein
MHAAFLVLGILLSQVPPVLLPCVPGDSTVVCKCKQGTPAACAELATVNPEALKGILRMAAMAQAAQEAGKAKEKAADAADTGCGGGQEPHDDEKTKCTGQWHHIISMTVWKALERHPVLKGQYTYRDSRFITHAKDVKAHCGWEGWHRRVDREVAKWVEDTAEATAQQFEAYLRQVYSRPELLERFPNGF